MTATIFAIGAIFCAAATSPVMLIVGRIVVGLGIGLASGTVPVYLSEISPAEVRGRQVSLFQLAITGQKSDVRTTQDILRHSSSATTLDLYTQSPMTQRIAAQESVLNAILKQPTRRARIRTVRNGSKTRLRTIQ